MRGLAGRFAGSRARFSVGGIRPTGVGALTYADLDVDDLSVSICNQLTFFNRPDFLVERLTKNEAGERDIPIRAVVADSVEEDRLWQQRAGTIDPRVDLVSGDARGLPNDSWGFMDHVLVAMAYRAGISKSTTTIIPTRNGSEPRPRSAALADVWAGARTSCC